jgi:hypothetical protein
LRACRLWYRSFVDVYAMQKQGLVKNKRIGEFFNCFGKMGNFA